MSDALKVRRPADRQERAPKAPTAATPQARPAASAWAAASVSAPFGLALPVQRKPVIGRADDAYEREADAVADRVVSRGTSPAPLAISRVPPAALAPPVQRMSPGDRTEHDDPPRPDAGGPGIVQRANGGGEEKPEESAAVQTKPADAVVQRAEEETKPGDDTTAVQAKGAPGGVAGGSPAMRDAAATAIATRGPGAPLPPRTRGTLESGMGVSLRDVRVHTGAAAEQATGALHARAFTHGRDIWVGRGESPSDTRLMAHEATHVLQQDGVVRRKPEDEPEPPPPPEPDDEARERPKPGEEPRPRAESAVAVAEEPEAGPPADAAASTPSARAPLPVVAPPMPPPLAAVAPGAVPAAPKTPTPAAATPPAAPSAPPPPSGPAAPRAATPGAATTTGAAKSPVSPAAPVTAPTAVPATKPGAAPTAATAGAAGTADAAAPTQTGETAPGAEVAPPPADSAAATEGAVPADEAQPESATAEAAPAEAEAAAEGDAEPQAEGAAGKTKEGAEGEPKEGAAEPKAEGAAKPAAGAAGEAAAAEAAAPPGPEADPNFQAAIHRLKGTAARERAHQPAAEAADDAQAAAVPPENDRLSRAGAAQVDSMSGAQVARPPTASFLELLRAKIAELAPKNLSELDDFKSSGKAAGMKADLTAGVAKAKNSATGDMKARTEAEPQPSSVEPKPVTPLVPPVPGPAPGTVGAARAVPPPQPAEAVSLDASSQSVDRQMAENDIDDPQLQEANDPRFSAVATARDEVKAHAAEAPAQYREEEAGIRGGAARANARDERGALGGMHAGKKRSQKSVSAEQEAARAADEARRREVADHVELLFNQTRAAVEGKLSSLDTDVNARFDAGEARARQQMEDHVDERKSAYKRKRYSGVRGKLRWGWDKLKGLPKETRVFYEEGRDLFIGEMDRVIVDISNLVEARLREAKDEVVRGRASIATYVEGLEGSLKKVGQDAQARVGEQFQELEQAIEDKKDDLASGLAQRYNDARQHADERLAEMRKADRGLVAAFVEKLGEIIEILRNFKRRLMAMLAEAADAIGTIVKHPIRFLGNLVSAVKQGVQRFSDHIVEHLKEGLFGWLFGALAAAGITIPSEFSLQSIFGLVLQVLGITTDTLRRKLGKLIGERNVELLEKAWGFVQRLVSSGIGGLWEEAKEHLSDLQETIFASVQEWVVTRIVKAAILKLVSMFNPAGAIIAAIQGIISTVQFFFERIDQILDLVQAVVSSVGRIARGDVDGAAGWIETSMARAIPLMISFLAGLLGLGGVSEKVRGIIQKLQHRVDAVIDKVIGKIVGVAKQLFGGKDRTAPGKAAAGKAALDKPTAEEEAQGPAAGKAAGQPEEEPFSLGREHHRFRGRIVKGRLVVEMASDSWQEFGRRIENLRQLFVTQNVNGYSDTTRASLSGALDAVRDKLIAVMLDVHGEPDPAEQVRKSNQGIDELEALFAPLGSAPYFIELEGKHQPPTHRFSASSVDAYGRATAALGDPVSSASHGRGGPASVDPAGIFLLRGVPGMPTYERGHLVAGSSDRSLGGPGNDRRNLVPVSPTTNISMRDGPEKAARDAIYDTTVHPPNILRYTARPQYHPISGLEAWLTGTLGAAPGGAHGLYLLAATNATLDAPTIHGVLRGTGALTLATVNANLYAIRRQLAYYFIAYRIDVTIASVQGPTAVNPSNPVDNHQGVTLP